MGLGPAKLTTDMEHLRLRARMWVALQQTVGRWLLHPAGERSLGKKASASFEAETIFFGEPRVTDSENWSVQPMTSHPLPYPWRCSQHPGPYPPHFPLRPWLPQPRS